MCALIYLQHVFAAVYVFMCRPEVNKVCLSWIALHFHFLRQSFLNLKLRHLARWSGQWAPFSTTLPILARILGLRIRTHANTAEALFDWATGPAQQKYFYGLAESFKKFNNSVWVSVQWHFSACGIKTLLFPAITSLHEVHTYTTFFYSVQLKNAQGLGKCLSGQTCLVNVRVSVQIPRAHSYIHYKHMHPRKLFFSPTKTYINYIH